MNNSWNNVEFETASIEFGSYGADDIDALYVDTTDHDESDIDKYITELIKSKSYDKYNVITSNGIENRVSKRSLYDIFIYVFFATYNYFGDGNAVITYVIFCDYYALDYNTFWKQIPNGIKHILVNELKLFAKHNKHISNLLSTTINEKYVLF
ncbi:MAG: hypothetical protein EOM87_04355 [Clostridia bacterium]|nr:hypothetical protein [Clostridia bacterium]